MDDSVLKGSILDIYIIEQNNEDKFNRGLLLNIGYLLSSEKVKYDRYIFHDVDLFPDQSIFELYFASPKKQIHYIIPKVEHKYNFEMYLGGVIGLSGPCFEKINGFPNNFLDGEAKMMLYITELPPIIFWFIVHLSEDMSWHSTKNPKK